VDAHAHSLIRTAGLRRVMEAAVRDFEYLSPAAWAAVEAAAAGGAVYDGQAQAWQQEQEQLHKHAPGSGPAQGAGGAALTLGAVARQALQPTSASTARTTAATAHAAGAAERAAGPAATAVSSSSAEGRQRPSAWSQTMSDRRRKHAKSRLFKVRRALLSHPRCKLRV
jgi:hypothetical protein